MRRSHGFSLIELMVIVVILGILSAIGMPAMNTWIANSRVRSTAEQLQNDLRFAQAEARARSRRVALVLTNAAPAVGAAPAANGKRWYVQTLPLANSDEVAGTLLRSSVVAAQGGVTITASAAICFNSAGRLINDVFSGTTSCTMAASSASPVEFTVQRTSGDRPLRVQVGLGGQVRLCDPAKTLSSDNPDGC